ncbi:MAG: formyltransferase [Elusimicrobiaceae bacterium]|nr:formyltransferase [Elusimicrobiaceae bacterium]
MESNRPKLLFFGFSMTGAAVLEELIKMGANIIGVYTYEDNPKENWFPSVKLLAQKNNIPTFTPEKLTAEDVQNIKNLAPDIILSVYYRSLISDEILKVAPLGAFNMHGSLLPKYRGRAPINWVLVKGEKETGATLHYMVAKADAGDIVGQKVVAICNEDTALTLTQKVTAAACEIIKEIYPLIETKNLKPRKQDMSISTYFGRRTPADGLIDWNQNAQTIYNLIRAVTKPFPGAFFEENGKKIIIWRAKVLPTKTQAAAGTTVSKTPYIITAADKDLEILDFEVQEITK